MLQDGETATKKITINDGASVVVPFTIHVEPNTHLSVSQQSRITFSAATDGGEDVIEKYLQIQPTSVMESVGTFGSVDVGKKDSSIAQDNKADTTSSDEQLDLTDIIHHPGTLIITYAPTLFSSVLASVDFLENYAYGCLEQRISALMPNILIKHLYNSAQEPFDLTKKFVNKWKNQRE